MKLDKLINRESRMQILRFCIVGFISVCVLYSLFTLLLPITGYLWAYTIGYVGSFVVNYCLSAFFTFKKKASIKNGLGFIFSHVVNYLMQVALLNISVWININVRLAPIFVLSICIPVNYLLTSRFFSKY